MEAQDIFNSQIIWFMIIISIVFSTILVIMIHLLIKYMNLKKVVFSQQKLIHELASLEIQKTKNKIKNGEI